MAYCSDAAVALSYVEEVTAKYTLQLLVVLIPIVLSELEEPLLRDLVDQLFLLL